MRVAIYSGVSRSTTFIERLIDGLAQQGVEILIFGTHNGLPNSSKQMRYYVYGNKLNKLIRLIKYTVLLSIHKPKEKKALDNIINSKTGSSVLMRLKYYPVLYYQPDVFHLQWAKSIEDWIWVKDFGIKFIISLRGAHINYSPITNDELAKTYITLFPRVDGFHAVSNAIALEALKYNSTTSKTHVIYSGLNLDKLPFEFKTSIHRQSLKILSIGRAHWKKGYQYALDAMNSLKHAEIPFNYTIIGLDEDEALLFQRWQKRLEDDVTFLEKQSYSNIISHIKKADVLLLPSLEEGIANVVLEAMALGTLVISTDCGGMPEVVVDGVTGYLVPVRDVQAMTAAIIKVSSLSIQDYCNVTRQARDYIETNHTENQMVTGMMQMYQKVMH